MVTIYLDFCSSPSTKHSRPAAFPNIPLRDLTHAPYNLCDLSHATG